MDWQILVKPSFDHGGGGFVSKEPGTFVVYDAKGNVIDTVSAKGSSGHEGYKVPSSAIASGQAAYFTFNGTKYNLTQPGMRHEFSFGNAQPTLVSGNGAIGSGGGGIGGAGGGSYVQGPGGTSVFVPSFVDFNPEDYYISYDEAKKKADQLSKENQDKYWENFNLSKQIARDTIDTEIQGLNRYVPEASRLIRNADAQNNSDMMAYADIFDPRNMEAANKATANNVNVRQTLLENSAPGTFESIIASRDRSEGDVTRIRDRESKDFISDSLKETAARSARNNAADMGAVGGFGIESGATRQLLDNFDFDKRIEIETAKREQARKGDAAINTSEQTVLNANKTAQDAFTQILAPGIQDFKALQLTPKVTDIGSQIRATPTRDAGSIRTSATNELNNVTMIRPEFGFQQSMTEQTYNSGVGLSALGFKQEQNNIVAQSINESSDIVNSENIRNEQRDLFNRALEQRRRGETISNIGTIFTAAVGIFGRLFANDRKNPTKPGQASEWRDWVKANLGIDISGEVTSTTNGSEIPTTSGSGNTTTTSGSGNTTTTSGSGNTTATPPSSGWDELSNRPSNDGFDFRGIISTGADFLDSIFGSGSSSSGSDAKSFTSRNAIANISKIKILSAKEGTKTSSNKAPNAFEGDPLEILSNKVAEGRKAGYVPPTIKAEDLVRLSNTGSLNKMYKAAGRVDSGLESSFGELTPQQVESSMSQFNTFAAGMNTTQGRSVVEGDLSEVGITPSTISSAVNLYNNWDNISDRDRALQTASVLNQVAGVAGAEAAGPVGSLLNAARQGSNILSRWDDMNDAERSSSLINVAGSMTAAYASYSAAAAGAGASAGPIGLAVTVGFMAIARGTGVLMNEGLDSAAGAGAVVAPIATTVGGIVDSTGITSSINSNDRTNAQLIGSGVPGRALAVANMLGADLDFTSNKPKEQQIRDRLRSIGEDPRAGGFLTKDDKGSHILKLADGSFFNIGKDGNAKIKNVATNIDGKKERRYSDVDWSNPIVNDVVALANPLSVLMFRNAEGKRMVGHISNAITAKNPTDLKSVKGNAKFIALEAGLDYAKGVDGLKQLMNNKSIDKNTYDVYLKSWQDIMLK